MTVRLRNVLKNYIVHRRHDMSNLIDGETRIYTHITRIDLTTLVGVDLSSLHNTYSPYRYFVTFVVARYSTIKGEPEILSKRQRLFMPIFDRNNNLIGFVNYDNHERTNPSASIVESKPVQLFGFNNKNPLFYRTLVRRRLRQNIFHLIRQTRDYKTRNYVDINRQIENIRRHMMSPEFERTLTRFRLALDS